MVSFFYRLVPEIPGCPKIFDIFIENHRALMHRVWMILNGAQGFSVQMPQYVKQGDNVKI